MKMRIPTIILSVLVIVLAAGWFNAEKKRVRELPAAYIDDFPPSYSLPTPENFRYFGTTIYYTGEATVTGEYMPSGFRDGFCFKVNQESRAKIPKQREMFCFKNGDEAAQMLYGVDWEKIIAANFEGYPNGTATIRINKYAFHISEISGIDSDSTNLVEVIK